MGEPKAHHYIPQTYLRNFTDSSGKLAVLLKDRPDEILNLRPREVAHHKHYYSQPAPGGGLDNRLEAMFSSIEGKWPRLVDLLRAQNALSPPDLESLFTFMVSLRTRIPAARDAAELFLAESVRSFGKQMEADGAFPPPPEGLEDALKFDNLEISIDPHQSIHLMVDAIRGLGPVVDALGYVAVRNTSGTPYISSDNPVVYFDPTRSDEELRPYTIERGGPAMLFFPVASDILLIGSTTYTDHFKKFGLSYQTDPDVTRTQRINAMIARFGYRQLYSSNLNIFTHLEVDAGLSPVPRFDRIPGPDGEFLVTRMVFGPRPKKPKWKTRPSLAQSSPARHP